MGVERLKEALEANDWNGGDEFGGDIDLEDLEEGDDEAEGSIGFGIETAELEAEMGGMKQAIYGRGGADEEGEDIDEEDGDKEVEQLQAMMLKMQAVRGNSTSWLTIETLANMCRFGSRSSGSRKEKICRQSC